MNFLNWELLKHPLNWITVILMCAFALITLSILYPEDGQTSET